MANIYITGVAGFIGFHLAQALLKAGHNVAGIDNLNPYYSPKLKQDRLAQLDKFTANGQFSFTKGNIQNKEVLTEDINKHKPQIVVHLAAQAGVRYCFKQPQSYIDSNLSGTFNVLQVLADYNKNDELQQLIMASSSSVYGDNTQTPFSETQQTDSPANLYAATKKAGEAMAYAYASILQVPIYCLRFFTVYGPWGRPDMAIYKFTEAIQNGQPIDVYNNGNMWRDYTYIDDIIAGILPMINKGLNTTIKVLPALAASQRKGLFNVYNIGNNKPEKTSHMINYIAQALGKEAKQNKLPMQQGEVHKTHADISKIKQDFNFSPQTSLQNGIVKFVDWYKNYTV